MPVRFYSVFLFPFTWSIESVQNNTLPFDIDFFLYYFASNSCELLEQDYFVALSNNTEKESVKKNPKSKMRNSRKR